VALVGSTESIAVAKAEATRLDYEVDADRQMIATGLTSLDAGPLQGFAVNGSLSKSAAAEDPAGGTDAPRAVPGSGERVRALLIDLEATADMDTAAADRFVDLVAALRRSGVRVMLARLHAALRDFMRRDDIIEAIGEGAIFPRVHDAVRDFETDAGD
jgi:MFS superfamily sulfate permease-like transporter